MLLNEMNWELTLIVSLPFLLKHRNIFVALLWIRTVLSNVTDSTSNVAEMDR